MLLTGVGGMTSFGQAAFVGFGAYTTAVLTTQFGFSPWATLPVSLVTTGLAALAIGLVTVRLSGHYLPLGTIAWGISFFYLFGNLAVLGGYDGISGIPPIAIGPLALIDAARGLLPDLARRAARGRRSATTCSTAAWAAPSGRCAAAARFAESFGVDTARLKLVVFVYAGTARRALGLALRPCAAVGEPLAVRPQRRHRISDHGGARRLGHVLGGVVGAGVVAVLNDQLQNWLPKLMEGGGNLDTIVFGIVLVAVAAVRAAKACGRRCVASGRRRAPKAVDLSAPPLPKRAGRRARRAAARGRGRQQALRRPRRGQRR